MEKLTPSEEEAMQVIWNSGGGIIKEFLDLLGDPRLPYTTLASTVKNLEKKGFIRGQKHGNTINYLPVIDENEYKRKFMNDFVSDYFSNSYKELVSFFASQQKISAEELKEIIRMIEKGDKL